MQHRKKKLLIILILVFLFLDILLITRIIGLAQRSNGLHEWKEHWLERFVPLEVESGYGQSTGENFHRMILIHFLPDCHFCQNEAAALRDNLSAFDGVRLLMISGADREAVKVFAVEYGLAGRSNVEFFLDPQQQFTGLFGTQAVPAIFIYDERGRLIKRYRGETKIEAILQHLNSDRHEIIHATTR